MHKEGPIIVIEDDADDQEILAEIFLKLAIQTRYNMMLIQRS